MTVTSAEKKRYVLSDKRDIAILRACKVLEQKKLSAEDRRFARLIKSQLIRDWRKPLEVALRVLQKKYRA